LSTTLGGVPTANGDTPVGLDLQIIDILIEVIALAQVLLTELNLHHHVALGCAFKLHAPQAPFREHGEWF